MNLYQPIAFLTNIRGTQLFIIILAVLLLFGAKRLPEVAKGLGKAIKEFRKSASQMEEQFRNSMEDTESEATKPTATAKQSEPATSEVKSS